MVHPGEKIKERCKGNDDSVQPGMYRILQNLATFLRSS